MPILTDGLKSLINKQGGYVVFLVLSEYSFIRDFRVGITKVKVHECAETIQGRKLYEEIR